MNPLLKPEDVALILGISRKTVHHLVRDGKLSCVQVTPRDRRFTMEHLNEFVRSQTISVCVDKKTPGIVSSPARKGGDRKESTGDFGTDLVKEIRSLCR